MSYGSLRPRDATATTFLDLHHSNTVGSPVTGTPTLDGSGREIGDVYSAVVSAVVLGAPNTATVTVTTASAKGPYHNKVFTGVLFDGTTPRLDIIPGVSWVPSSSGSLANGWTAVFYVGIWANLLTAGNPGGTQLSWATGIGTPGVGAVSPGDAGFIAKINITNTGATVLTGCTLALHPRAKLVLKSGARAFTSFQVVNDTPSEHVTATQTVPINFTFANLDTAATPDEIDVKMDGATFDVVEVDTGTPLTSTQLKMDGTTRYQISEAGAYCEGAIFVLASTATNSSEENVLVFNVRHVEIALDVAGTPGTWGTTDLALTQSGEPSGNINPAGACNVWVRLDTSSLSSNKQNPFPADLFVEYNDTGEADWLG
jgi:hypothetical protein